MRRNTLFSMIFTLGLLQAMTFGAAEAQEETLDLGTMTCIELAQVAPESVQTTVMGLSVGYAMGQDEAAFDLETANRWFAAFRDFCKVAPDTLVVEVLRALPEHIEAR